MRIAYLIRSSKFLFILKIFCFFSGSVAYAEVSGYVGATISANNWQMAFASGKGVQVFDKELKSNKPDPLLYMGGISASLVFNKTWALSYQGEVGFAKPLITLNGKDDTESADVSLASQTNIFRYDNSIALSRFLGSTGFGIFVGAKIQAFGYKQPSGKYTVAQNGIIVQEADFEGERRLITYGPAAGLSYSRPLFSGVFAAIQAGVIYFPGNYTNRVAVNIEGAAPASSNEKFYGIGFTSIFSLAFPVTDRLLLQGAFRMQYYRTKTLEATTTQGNNQKTTSVAGALDNTEDILLGVQAAVIYKVF